MSGAAAPFAVPGVGHGRGHAKVSQHRPGLRQPLRGHMERFAVAQYGFGYGGPPRSHQFLRVLLPRRCFPNRQQDDREQQVVKLVRVTDIRPGL